jgi:hypothetical protein
MADGQHVEISAVAPADDLSDIFILGKAQHCSVAAGQEHGDIGRGVVVPVRIDPELRAAIEALAEADHITTREIIREAIRCFLHIA